MDYNVIIITEADFSDDPPSFTLSRRPHYDFKVAVGEAIAEWQRDNPNESSWRPAVRCSLSKRRSLVWRKPLLMRWLELEGAGSSLLGP
jgi:hypothetical protein